MDIQTLGESRFNSPIQRTVDERVRIPVELIRDANAVGDEEVVELAGPRSRLFFDAPATRAGIVTCGGLCPGLNNVIRSVCRELNDTYGVTNVLGFRGGYRGLDPSVAEEPMVLTRQNVDDIHRAGGTILGTSRGPVDPKVAVDNLVNRKINILFTVGGDGTQRGAVALYEEAKRRGYPLAVIGIPKTIDNDVAFVTRSFGFLSAVAAAAKVLECAHTEAHSVHNGIAIVKLMGRHAGFIAAAATVASQDVNFCLIPEAPFTLDGERGLLQAIRERLARRGHAVIVAAEGAGQELLKAGTADTQRDASGNVKLGDIGVFLQQRVAEYFKSQKIDVTIRYIDPSYTIRSVPADPADAILCDQFARHAVHAAMAGKTAMVVGLLHDKFVNVPIDILTSRSKRVDPAGSVWHAVLATTGQSSLLEG